MTEKDYAIVCRAFLNVCKWLRENPPVNVKHYTNGLIFALTDGTDKEGSSYAKYFLAEAKEQLDAEDKDVR